MAINPTYTKCPKCETIHMYTDVVSENTAETGFWSDGFLMSPMKTDMIKFGKCHSCNAFFWIQENSFGEIAELSEFKNLGNSWSLDNISSKEIDFIKDALRSGLANTFEKEIIIRIKLWHTINHIIRKNESKGLFKKIKQRFLETSDFKESQKLYNSYFSLKLNNLIRLSNLLKQDKNENTNYLLFAEIYRELGDFSKAMIFCHKAETSSKIDSNRIMQLKHNITSKNKMAYKL
jgi:hypothetical protein